MAAITGTIAAVGGLALSAAGSIGASSAAKDQAKAQQQITALEMKAEAERQKAMELDARRRMLEMIRNQQRARALALTAATSQGASLGSGLQGGYGQISGETGVNLLGVSNNLEIGRNLFSINQQIGQQKINMANAATSAATWGALGGIGGSLFQASGTIGSLSKGWGSGSNSSPSYGGFVSGINSNGIY